MIRILLSLPLLGLMLLAAGGGSHLQAAPVGISLRDVRVGMAGKYKAGHWTPIWITLAAGNRDVDLRGELVVVASDGDRTPVVFQSAQAAAIHLAAGKQQTFLRYCKVGPVRGELAVQLRRDGEIVWQQAFDDRVPPPLQATQELIVTLGPAVGVEQAIGSVRRAAELSYAAARVERASALPDRWWGYEGVDCLVVTTSAGNPSEQLRPEQVAAIQEWVRLGGKLLLSVGSQADIVLASGDVWREMTPGTPAGVEPLRESLGLETFAGSELSFDEQSTAARPQVAALDRPRGRVLLDEGGVAAGRPLIVHSPYGLGQVTFVALDLDHPTIASWDGRRRLIANLLQGGQSRREDQSGETRRSVTHRGYDDLVGQLGAALEQFPGVTMVNFTTVSVLTIVYLLLIGPGDYLLLSWTGLPRHVTWMTFPLVAAAFCGLAWYIGSAAHGGQVRINQVEVVDVDAEQAIARGTVWTHLYSPATSRFDLAFAVNGPLVAAAAPVEGVLAWQGLPGTGLGGLASQSVSLSEPAPYTIATPGTQPAIEALPIQVASTKSLSARWWGRVARVGGSDLKTNEFGLVEGKLNNPFPADLTDALLIHHESLYRLGNLHAGQTVSLADYSPLNLEWRLTERMVVDTKDQTTPWRQDSTDVPRIVQMMMFHDVARGRSYTGLTHRYQPYLDLSDHVRSGRAILVGRSSQRVATVRVGDEASGDSYPADGGWTFFRLVLPVASGPSTSADP